MAAAGAVITQVLRRQNPALRFCPPPRPVPPRASCSVNECLPSWRSWWGREQADARSSRTLRTPVSGFFNVGCRKQHSPRLCTYGLHCRLRSPPLLRLPVSYGHDTDCIIASVRVQKNSVTCQLAHNNGPRPQTDLCVWRGGACRRTARATACTGPPAAPSGATRASGLPSAGRVLLSAVTVSWIAIRIRILACILNNLWTSDFPGGQRGHMQTLITKTYEF